MLTRGRKAAATHASPDTVLSPLPPWFVRAVFLLLPADRRLRCCKVNRAWRALLSETSFWMHIDLSTSSGCAYFSEALLRAAVAKAGGQLRSLDITGRLQTAFIVDLEQSIQFDALNAAVVSNAASLTELRVFSLWNGVEMEDVRAVLTAAPSLQHFELGILCCQDVQEARLMLRNEAPFGALRLRYIHIHDTTGWTGGQAAVASFCSDLRRHVSLEALGLARAPVNAAEAMGALVDACISLRLRILHLIHCDLTPAVVPALTRLVTAGALREIEIADIGRDNFFTDEGETQRFCAAVRASSINKIDMFGFHACAAIRALTDYINARRVDATKVYDRHTRRTAGRERRPGGGGGRARRRRDVAPDVFTDKTRSLSIQILPSASTGRKKPKYITIRYQIISKGKQALFLLDPLALVVEGPRELQPAEPAGVREQHGAQAQVVDVLLEPPVVGRQQKAVAHEKHDHQRGGGDHQPPFGGHFDAD